MKKTVLAVCIAMAVTPRVFAAETVSPQETTVKTEQHCLVEDSAASDNPAPGVCEEEMAPEQLASIVASATLMAAAIAGAVHTYSDSDRHSSGNGGGDNGGGDNGGGDNGGGDNGGGDNGGGDNGDPDKIDINEDVTVSDGVGKVITGDKKEVTVNGDVNVSGGGTGVVVDGNNNAVVSEGDTNVSGDGSLGMSVTGDNNSTTINGALTVRDGATGIAVSGNNATVTSNGDINVADDNSTGIKISGNNASYKNTGDIYVTDKGTGVTISGDSAKVVLDGSVLVDAGESRNPARGVVIASDNASLLISGDVRVSDIQNNIEGTTPSLTGVSLDGSDSTVVIDGKLGLEYYGTLSGQPASETKLQGLAVMGSNNSVAINGGLDYSMFREPGTNQSSTEHHKMAELITLSGSNNIVRVSGESSIRAEGGMIKAAINVNGKNNMLWLDDASIFNIVNNNNQKNLTPSTFGNIRVGGESSTFINDGIITATENVRIISSAASSGTSVNNGTITVDANPGASEANTNVYYVMYARGNGDAGYKNVAVLNSSSGVINISSALAANNKISGYDGTGQMTAGNYENTQYGLYTYTSYAENQGEMNLNGTSIFGVSSLAGTAKNSGTINLDAMQLETDTDNKLTGNKTVWSDVTNTLRGSAVSAGFNGESDAGRGGVGINTGTINVNNAGFGMVAYRWGSVINEGTINLTADHELADGMYAMAAVGSYATAINGEKGVININTDLGKAFYTANGGVVINNGTVNLNGSGINSGDAGWGEGVNESTVIAVGDSILSASGEDKTYANEAGKTLYFYAENVTSDGQVTFKDAVQFRGNVTNRGTMKGSTLHLTDAGNFYNSGTIEGSMTGSTKDNNIVNTGTIIANEDGAAAVSKRFVLHNQEGGLITNSSQAAGSNSYLINHTNSGRLAFLVNRGDIEAKNGYGAITMTNASNSSNTPTWLYNTDTGRIAGTDLASGMSLIKLGNGYSFHNAGEISFTGAGSNGISMNTSGFTSYVVNDGVINVGTEEGKNSGTNGTGLAGIRTNKSSNVVYNNAGGVINVWADKSYAFVATTDASKTKVVNNGTVNLLCDTGCGISGSSNLVVSSGSDYTGTGRPGTAPSASSDELTDYVIGTNADGSAGKLFARRIMIGNNVAIDTGFTTGLSDREVTFKDVLSSEGEITGKENIASSSVVWNAQASQNAAGNIDVTMTKNDYASVSTDASAGSIAAALDKGYTSNSLYSSLNVSSASALNKALNQVSGSQAKSLNREARVLGQRFNMLADTAPVTTESGLSMNLVAKGDKRAEMDNKVTYDMMALRQVFDTSVGQFSASYGMARLSGKGGNEGNRAGDNGLTGGYSQFFGLGHSMALGENSSWDNSLRYDLHNLNSSRNISFEGTSRVARSSGRQQHMEFRSEGVKKMELAEGLTVAPFAGAKMRHHITDGYQEHGAGDFNLKTSSYSETGVDAVAGMRLNYVGKDGWGAQATFEAGPNLGFSQSARKASLQGVQGQQFSINDGKRGGGVNSQAMVSANYNSANNGFAVSAYQWKEDGASDKGMSLNFSRSF